MRLYRFFLITGMVIFLLAACRNDKKQSSKPKTVKTEVVVIADEGSGNQYPGKVRAANEAGLSFKVNGTLQRIRVKEGQRVRKGDLIAELDPIDYKIQLDATEAEYKQIKAEAERVMAVYKEGGTTANNYDKAVYGLKQITAKYEHHKDMLRYTKLYAPYDGIVEKHFFDEHETIGAGMPVISFVGSGALEVKINLPSKDFVNKDKFCSYTCTFDVFPGVVYTLKPKSISPKANANQLYTMVFDLVSDKEQMPSSGMNTMVTIVNTPDKENIKYLVPSTSVFEKDGISHVYIFSTGTSTVKAIPVDLIFLKSDGDIIISSAGIKAGDLVVSSGVHHINDGDPVRLITTTSKTNVGGLL